jgi:hypothetical protein
MRVFCELTHIQAFLQMKVAIATGKLGNSNIVMMTQGGNLSARNVFVLGCELYRVRNLRNAITMTTLHMTDPAQSIMCMH